MEDTWSSGWIHRWSHDVVHVLYCARLGRPRTICVFYGITASNRTAHIFDVVRSGCLAGLLRTGLGLYEEVITPRVPIQA